MVAIPPVGLRMVGSSTGGGGGIDKGAGGGGGGDGVTAAHAECSSPRYDGWSGDL